MRPHWNNVVITSYQRWNNVETMLCNVGKPLHRCCVKLIWHCFNVGHRRCINVVQRWKFDFRFCFTCNVWSTLFQRRPTMLKHRWYDVEIGWVVSMKKLILRNILPATLLTYWNLYAFLKDYAKIFTKSVLTNFFWWLLQRIRLRLVVSNSSGLEQVPS